MIIMDAPSEITAVFEHWLDGGRSWRETTILQELLWPYRGTQLLTDEHVFWLAKRSDRRDEIRVEPRSMPLGRAGVGLEAVKGVSS